MAPNKCKKGKKKAADKGDGENDQESSSPVKLKPATSINVRHILCEKLSKLEKAVEELKTGKKFDEVAKEFSEDKARQGGSLGWKTRGSLDPDFEKVAYEIEPSTVGDPKYRQVKTDHGYHLIMVEGRK